MAQKRSELENLDRIDRSGALSADRNPDFTASDTDAMDLSASKDYEEMDFASDADDTPEEAEHIRGQIEETRNQMGETIDAIQERLSFSNLSEQVSDHVSNAVETAKDAVYDATIGKAAGFMKNFSDGISNTSIVRTARNNPLPFILIGLGAGLLAYQNYSGKSRFGGGSRRHEFAGRREFSGQIDDRDPRTETDTTPGVTRRVSDTVSTAAATAYDKVTGAVDTAYTGAGEVVGQAYRKVGDVGSVTREKYDYYLEENPLALGAVALALGTAVGIALPTTRYEGELLGHARQELLHKAQDTASGLLDKTKQVVNEAGRTITEQTRSLTEH